MNGNKKLETTMLDPKVKKDSFSENKATDEALQRITAAAARHTQPTPLPGGQEGEEATEDKQEEPQASTVWRFFEEQATGDTATRSPTADAILGVRSYLEEPRFQRCAVPLSSTHVLHMWKHADCAL